MMKGTKITVYTCIVGNYDLLMPPPVKPDGVRFFCFTDRPHRKVDGWEMLPLVHPSSINRPDLINRYHKLFPHHFLLDTEWSVYIDGNVRLIGNIFLIIDRMASKGAVLACPEHPRRSTIFEEAKACEVQGKFDQRDRDLISRQLAVYKAEGMPKDAPLAANYLVIRCHKSDVLDEAMKLWWEQLQIFTRRDQISLPYVLWKTGLAATQIPKDINESEPYYIRHRHKKSGINGWFQRIRLYRNEVIWYWVLYKLRKWLLPG